MFNKIKADMLTAMKERRKEDKDCLAMLVNKLQNEAKSKRVDVLSEADCVRVVQKYIKELDEEKANFEKVNRLETVEKLSANIKLVSAYLPKMLSEDEIKSEIATLTDKTMPSIMKHFKLNFAGKVDMGLVSKIAKNI